MHGLAKKRVEWVRFGATGCKTVRSRLSDRCPVLFVCLSVTLVYCGQTVGWIRMPLGMEVGLSQGHIVLDGDRVPQEKGTQPPSRIFVPSLLWPNSSMDQDATWYRGRPRSRRHCVRWGPMQPPRKGHSSPQFSANV